MRQINEVVMLNGQRHLILFLNSGDVVWINIDQDKGTPEAILEEQLGRQELHPQSINAVATELRI